MGFRSTFWVVPILVALAASSLVPPSPVATGASSGASPSSLSTGPSPSPTGPSANARPDSPLAGEVAQATAGLEAIGVPLSRIPLPFLGPSSELADGAIVPGALRTTSPSGGVGLPSAQGIAYYGAGAVNGTLVPTVVNASSVGGELDARHFDGLYTATSLPDQIGIQLNAFLADATVQGHAGFYFWCQNVAYYIAHNDTILLTGWAWNFTSTGGIPSGRSTIASHAANGTIVGGLFYGGGGYVYAPKPFDLSLYLNSSLTPQDEQEVWFNFSLAASGQTPHGGTISWFVLNSTNPAHPATVARAAYQANGKQASPEALPLDFELDFGIGTGGGSVMDMFAANATASLSYCPASTSVCSLGQRSPVPSAIDAGAQTGEQGVGLAFSFVGTTAEITAGPHIVRRLWGYAGFPAAASGEVAVTNDITFSGEPDPGGSAPYAFVFFNETGSLQSGPAWAPDVPVWYLAPGNYSFEVMLADYHTEGGTLRVNASATTVTTDLPFATASGVYTPLWAFDDAGFAGVSTAGNGTLGSPYLLVNTPTSSCTGCAGAPDGELAAAFSAEDDYGYPAFPGLLLRNTTAFAQLNAPVRFAVGAQAALFLDLVQAEHVTIRNANRIGGVPLPNLGPPPGFSGAQDVLYPTADLVLWNSSDDLVMADRFVPAEPAGRCINCIGSPPSEVSPDQLLLYGGTNNTVWGDTFVDAGRPGPAGYGNSTGPQLCGAACALYGGIAEAEGGDLIYNNNFSIDNPVIYLPYDLYTGQTLPSPPLPPALTDRWNVTNQSAGTVSDTVNGIPLSGNILGPSYPTQGGNFWWNFGDALNPQGTLPYTDRFDYSNDSGLFPAGASLFEPGIRVGGDDLPLRPISRPGLVVIHETGLPLGSNWSVYLGLSPGANGTAGKGGDRLEIRVGLGPVNFTVFPPIGYGLARATGGGSPSLGPDAGPGLPIGGSLNASLITSLTLRFGAFRTSRFVESIAPPRWPGLPAGTSWGVSLSAVGSGFPAPPPGETTNGSSLSFDLPHGVRYAFQVNPPAEYRVRGGRGVLTQPDVNATRSVGFALLTAPIVFVEQGLPPGTAWSVTLTGPVSSTLSGSSSTARFLLVNGTYQFTIGPTAGRVPSPANGTLVVVAPHPQRIPIAYT